MPRRRSIVSGHCLPRRWTASDRRSLRSACAAPCAQDGAGNPSCRARAREKLFRSYRRSYLETRCERGAGIAWTARGLMTDTKPAKRASRGPKVEHLQLPPHSVHAEQSLLGCLMLDPAAWSKISGLVDEASFFRPDHRLIYRAVADLQALTSAIDITTLTVHLEQRGELADTGRSSHLGMIQRGTPTAPDLP